MFFFVERSFVVSMCAVGDRGVGNRFVLEGFSDRRSEIFLHVL